MSDRKPVDNDPAVPVVFEFTSHSPHVFAYRLWFRRPGEEEAWESCDCCEGDTEEADRDPCDLGPLPDGTELDVPVAVGGEKDSGYRASLVLTQNDRPMPGGTIELSGHTSGEGGAAEYLRLVLA